MWVQKAQPYSDSAITKLCDSEKVPLLLWASVPSLGKGSIEESVSVVGNTPTLSHKGLCFTSLRVPT